MGWRIQAADLPGSRSLFGRPLDRAAEADASGGDRGLVRGPLREALALWRGEPMAGVDSELLRRDVATALTERYLSAVEWRVDLALAAGRLDGLVAQLRTLTAEHGLRERLWARLLTALAASGRVPETLSA